MVAFIAIGKLLLGLLSLARQLFPSDAQKLGRAEQANTDSAASIAAEKVKHAVPAAPAAAVDDSLLNSTF